MLTLLKDIRVLEISTVVMGPLAGQILADLGAEVIKVESLQGDGARAAYPQQAPGMGALYVNNNRNKKAIALDLRNPESRPIIERLIARSDVLLHNLRPESAQRLGIAFHEAAAINPRIVYCSAIGFGQAGRYRNRPAYDDIVQAVSGLAAIAGGEDPRFIPTILADKVSALHAVYGILASLIARANGREGPIQVQVPMFEAMASFVLNEHLAGATFSEDGKVGYPRILSEHRRPHRTRDGWIAVLPYTAEQWRRFLIEIGRPEICQEPWFIDAPTRQSRIGELYSIVSTSLATRTTAEWIETLSRLDVPCSEVNRLEDLLHDPHLADVDFFSTGPEYPPEIVRSLPQPVEFEGVDTQPDHAAPALGANTREILRSLALNDEKIDRLLQNGIAREPLASPTS